MTYQQTIKPISEFTKELAKYSGKIVARIRAEGPLNCKDPEKVKKIWQYYEDKVPFEVLSDLMSYGDIFCYFSTPNEAQTEITHWFPNAILIEDEEYTDVDEDYYISVDCVDENELPVVGF